MFIDLILPTFSFSDESLQIKLIETGELCHVGLYNVMYLISVLSNEHSKVTCMVEKNIINKLYILLNHYF